MILNIKRMKNSNKEYCNSFKGVPILIDCFQVDTNMRSKCSTLPFFVVDTLLGIAEHPAEIIKATDHGVVRWVLTLRMLYVFAHVHRVDTRTNVHVEKTPGRNYWMVGVWEYDICVLRQDVFGRCIWGSSVVIQQHVAWSMMLFCSSVGTISEGPIYVVTKLDKEIMGNADFQTDPIFGMRT